MKNQSHRENVEQIFQSIISGRNSTKNEETLFKIVNFDNDHYTV
ncbi:hypothetical protein [Methanococcus maripaludis]|uniref:Uncharacterized protein n=1 Tax=Methanococcus maripaludis TaxID=39152 RepID=A0A7J9S2T9_METMI|nr:hypothetical protein [Methanococcus maripaludis]MBB6067848.1 hypothetical protein [Methanococcus maripaludis]